MHYPIRVLRGVSAALAALSTVLLLVAAPSVRADDAAAKKEIKAVFNRASQFISKKDVDGLMKLAAPDAKAVFADGKTLSKEEWTAATKKMFAKIDKIHGTVKAESINVRGKQAIATFTETDDYTMTGDKGKFHEVDKGSITFNKTDKGWVPVTFVFNSSKITRDGKPFTPPKEK